MGVAGLWEVLKPAAETRSMTDVAVTDGFIANPQGLRGFRLGIDASIWFFHAEYGREGENPVLRTLFFRCATLMRTTFLPLFVFDGPKRPDFKRGKKINKTAHKLIPGMKAIIEAFGFEWRMAPAEAEAELAYLNRVGIIDGILSDDVDNFLFGATTLIRNISNNLSGNRANPILNCQGKDDKNHTRMYRSSKILTHPSISLTRGGLILIGLLSGGDYAQAGLPGCGISTAHALARCGFGDSLYEAAITLPREALPDFLATWREEFREELRTNSRGIIGRKLAKLAKQVPRSFPDIEILLSYANPITSESLGRAAEKNVKLTWSKEPDVGKLAALCEFYFEWGYKEAIIKRFRTLLWHSIVLRILRRAVLNLDASPANYASEVPSTPKNGKSAGKPRVIGTPSKMIARHFASLALNSPFSHNDQGSDAEDEELDRLIVKIHSSRNHASTDGLLEYRLEIAPAQLVQLAEAGIKGTREPPEQDEWASDESDDLAGADDESDSGRKPKKGPPDPVSHLRLWMPACMVELAEPEVVNDFKEREERKRAKKSGRSRKEAGGTKTKRTDSKSSSKSSNASGSNASERQLYCSDSEDVHELLSKIVEVREPSPSRTSANRKLTRDTWALRQESEESESDVPEPKPPTPRKGLAKPSKQNRIEPTERPKQRSLLEYLSVSSGDERRGSYHVQKQSVASVPRKEPAPFPVTFDLEVEVEVEQYSSPDEPTTTPRKSRPAIKSSRPISSSRSSAPETHKSPRKSLKHRSPRGYSSSRTKETSDSGRPVSPSPLRPLRMGMEKGVGSTSVIEISSDESDSDEAGDSNAMPLLAAKSKVVLPLMLAKARSQNAAGGDVDARKKLVGRGVGQGYLERRVDSCVIDLT
ncbi:hypothetical protein AX17_003824 [Amanita inopinata Kibby_2008]|nr:hypothetical protein AX17_003824 [Amanita inopinata Kibby_2008]